jgi:hypothetical protein
VAVTMAYVSFFLSKNKEVLMDWNPSSGNVEFKVCKNLNERAILGVCVNHTHVVATLYFDSNTFVFHF